jgi:lipopolysaccharide transport system ATP-binding protein
MKPILEVHNLSKEFLIGANNEPYLALRDVLANPFKLLNQPKKEVFKALDNVSFDVMPGESIGIIGRNGAGKSTLLKILSKITPPSSGKIICRGRIAALLEVGTGFHAELTGRENVYMNGSILGMRKWEIDKHFDEIVSFSGVEKFLDTPLKRYSSGMQLRLAFAVAAHLEPEILIIDEVLAVGDAEFQKKCLGKMDEVTKSGRTVLFVSHNMAAIANLCYKSILMNQGSICSYTDTNTAIEAYNNMLGQDIGKYKNQKGIVKSAAIQGDVGSVDFKEPIKINIEIDYRENDNNTYIGVAMLDKWKRKIFTTHTPILNGKTTYTLILPSSTFLQGNYSFDIAVFVQNSMVYEYLNDVCAFEIHDFSSELSIFGNADIGILNINAIWD